MEDPEQLTMPQVGLGICVAHSGPHQPHDSCVDWKQGLPVSPATQPEQTAAPQPEPETKGKKAKAPVRGLELLRKPFADNQISILCKPTKKDNPEGRCNACKGWHKLPAIQLSYVGHAALTDRLLDADPEWNWEPLTLAPNGTPLIDGDGGMWIKLTVCGVTRLGYGDAQGKVGGNAMKERIGDALRNAAMRFGAALDLWHKGGDLHADSEAVDEKLAAENEAEHLTKFRERERIQPPAERPDYLKVFEIQAIDEACKRTGKSDEEVKAYLELIGTDRIEHIQRSGFKATLAWANAKPIPKPAVVSGSKIVPPKDDQRTKAMRRLWATAAELSIPENDVKQASYEKFHVDSMTKLTEGQLDEMTDWVKAVARAVSES